MPPTLCVWTSEFLQCASGVPGTVSRFLRCKATWVCRVLCNTAVAIWGRGVIKQAGRSRFLQSFVPCDLGTSAAMRGPLEFMDNPSPASLCLCPLQEYHIQFTESSFLRDAPFPVVRSWRRDLPCLLAKYVEDVEVCASLSSFCRQSVVTACVPH